MPNSNQHSNTAKRPAGSSNAALQELRVSAVPRGVSTMLPVFIEKAKNAEIWDVEGKRYIDFASGIAVVNTGHGHPAVMQAAAQQLNHFTHACFQVTPYDGYVTLADRLNRMVPGPTPKKTILLSTGAEALENAIKIARAHTRRPATIAFSGGFHGRTMMGMALTGKVVPYKTGFGPFPQSVYHLPFPIAYHGVTEADSLRALETLFKADVEPTSVAAMVIEPLQGEGGFYVASASFLKELRAICDKHGIVMVLDEVQSGFARTGRMLAVEHAGIEPDLVCMAKGLAGGFPLSAVTGKAEIMDAPAPGGLGGTYAGSPVACAAAHAVMDTIEAEKLCERAVKIGDVITKRLNNMRRSNTLKPVIGDVRGLGAMIGLELVQDGDAEKPNAPLTQALVQECARRGLIVLSCGVRANVIRFLMPLTIPDAHLDEGLTIFEHSLAHVVENLPATQ